VIAASGRSDALVTTPGCRRTHWNIKVHAPAPQRPVHSSKEGRNEKVVCMRMTKKNMKFAKRNGTGSGRRSVSNGLGTTRTAASSRQSSATNTYGMSPGSRRR
jgi:hypothetical protein